MKVIAIASLATLMLLSASAQAAPKSMWTMIDEVAPKSVFDELHETAPRSDPLKDVSARSDGVYGDLERSAP